MTSRMSRPSLKQSRRRTWQQSCPRPRRCFATRVSASVLFISPYRTLPGIYDRSRGRERAGGSYIDNLALADRSLAEMMAALSTTALASKTTVIVCSDHSWRVPMWRLTATWTKEDEVASHGRFDSRPVLYDPLSRSAEEHIVTAPFASIGIHDIIERMLQRGHDSFP